MSIWSPLAQEGHPAALYSIGLLYDQGKGVKQNSQKALNYFQQATRLKLPAAQYYLGIKYYAGLGINKDLNKARELLIQAAEQDHLEAQFQLGLFYEKGEGGQQDSELATYWITKAAENGFGPAQHTLAARYLTGNGVQLNLKKGVFWMEKAAEQYDFDAMRDLGFLYIQGMGVEKDYKRARELLIVSADENSALAQFLLGEIHATGGYGIEKNLSEARDWYQKAQQSGYKEARIRLSQLSDSQFSKKTYHPEKIIASETGNPSVSDADRFKQLSDKQFVLQILQARHFESISKLTNQYTDNKTFVFKIVRSGQPMYVLLYGQYDTYSDAKQGIKALPATFQLQSNPWIRQVKTIKIDML